MENEGLEKVFSLYTRNKSKMTTNQFVKVFKDNKLLDKNFNSTSIDIIFSKVKTKGTHKITFP